MTKKDLLEAIKDMPMEAEIKIVYFDEDEEIRDTFKENFDKDLEFCKELL